MSTTPSEVVWLDGALREPHDASVHWSDHGLTVGDGVFETIELRDGRPFALRRHLQRLTASASSMALTLPGVDTIEQAVAAVAGAWGPRHGRLRITCTAGPGPAGSGRGPGPATLLVTATSMTIATTPTDVLVVPWTRNEHGALAGVKSTSYGENVVALAAAAARGCSEALFANTRGELCEGTGANVFVVLDGRLVTPPLDSGCLAGISRALLLEAMAAAGTPAHEAAVPMDRLPEVTEAFLVSTARHVQPVRGLLGATRSDLGLASAPGEHTRRAAQVWREAYGSVLDP